MMTEYGQNHQYWPELSEQRYSIMRSLNDQEFERVKESIVASGGRANPLAWTEYNGPLLWLYCKHGKSSAERPNLVALLQRRGDGDGRRWELWWWFGYAQTFVANDGSVIPHDVESIEPFLKAIPDRADWPHDIHNVHCPVCPLDVQTTMQPRAGRGPAMDTWIGSMEPVEDSAELVAEWLEEDPSLKVFHCELPLTELGKEWVAPVQLLEVRNTTDSTRGH